MLGRSGLIPGTIVPDIVVLWEPGNGAVSSVVPAVDFATITVAGGITGDDTSNTDAWDDPKSGGRRRPADDYWSTAALATLLGRYKEHGLPVFTADYARTAEDIAEALKTSREYGFVPTVSRTPLDRVPEHVFR